MNNLSIHQQFSCNDDSSASMSIPSEPDTEMEKQVPNKQRAPRKRKLRPEDERTLKLLTEKFHCVENGAKCQLPNCKSKPLKSLKTSNLKRHILQVHPKDFATIFPNEVSSKKRAELDAFNLVQDAIELVTVNGQQFSILSATGMKGFIRSRLDAIRAEGVSLKGSVDRFNIVKLVAEEAELIKKRISEEVKGKTVSIMFDVCTIATLSMLGVQAVYMKGEDVVCRSLGTIQIEERHTSVNLADMVFDILAEYNITLPKVISITSDTAKNAIATTEILNLVAESKGESNIDSSFFDIPSDEEDDGLEFGVDVENEVELQKVIQVQTELVQDMSGKIASKSGDKIVLINQINCGTHVFQLAVNDAIAKSNSKGTIDSVHNMCVLMRNQIVMIEIRKLGSKVILPPMDNLTRWNSKFLMVSTFFVIVTDNGNF